MFSKYFFGLRVTAVYSKGEPCRGREGTDGIRGVGGGRHLPSYFLCDPPLTSALFSPASYPPGQWYDSVLPKAFTVSHYREADRHLSRSSNHHSAQARSRR